MATMDPAMVVQCQLHARNIRHFNTDGSGPTRLAVRNRIQV